MKGIGVASYKELRHDFVGGMRAMAPWLVGSAPFGLVIGVTAAQADLPTLVGWLTGPLIFGGTAQVATIQMLDTGAAPSVVILTVMVINLRLAIYSAAMATYWRGTPLWWRLLGGYLLVDPSFVVGAERYDQDPDRQRGHPHYLGGAILLWVTWLTVISVGAMVGAQLPEWLRLDFLIVLYLVGEIVSKLRQAAARRAVLVAGAVALLCLGVPLHLGIAIGIVAGIAAGLAAAPAARSADRGPAALSTEESRP